VASPLAFTLTAATAAETQAIAERLGGLLAPGDVLALVGPLGAGKTTFVQGLARGLGVPPERHVASPTFALVNEHPGRVPLVHADLYRIEDARELAELGLTDAFDRAAVAIEWLDRFPDAAPADRLEIAIAFGGGDARTLTFTPAGSRASELADQFRSPLPAPRGEG
jgi:tRNA threonylcarbamoyladenosine biosynthesis protein TsaE